MVAALLQLDHSPTLEAALPAFLLSLLKDLICLFVLGALSRRVPFPVTQAANFGLAAAAFAHLAAFFSMDVLGFDPLAAPLGWAVDAVPGRELDELFVPAFLKCVVKQSVHMLQRDIIGSATLGRHELRVRYGQFETPLEARGAHPMIALELSCLGRGQLTQADDALDTMR